MLRIPKKSKLKKACQIFLLGFKGQADVFLTTVAFFQENNNKYMV